MSSEDESMVRIAKARRILRDGARLMVEKGVPIEDVAIGALYAAFDLAEMQAGPEQAAIEWLRTGVDTIERALYNGAGRAVE